jgi:hypothetical protein
MKILIPTYMRETKQKCWENLPEEIRKKTYLCTHSDRVSILKENYPEANVHDIGITDGIADVRQKLLYVFSDEKVFIIDDSCTFTYREDMKLKKIETSEKFEEMLATVETMLDTYPMVGISDRGGNNRVPESFQEIGRSYSCYGINIKKFKEHGIRFDGMYQDNKEIKLFEDFYVILSLLSKGLKNAILYEFAFNHPHGAEGGNSVHRTNELQKKCYQELSRRFPGIVKLVEKKDASWVLDKENNSRTEAIISWKKCFEGSNAKSTKLF